MPRLPPRLALLGFVLLLVGCAGGAALPAPVPEATVASFSGNGDPPLLADVAWLRARIAEPDPHLLILDASPLRVYREGHIPGAVHTWWQDTMDPNGAVYGQVLKPDENLPDPQQLRREHFQDQGIDNQTRVVVYDDERGRWAARIVWTLRFLGHNQATVLDGGLAAWIGAGGAVEATEQEPPDRDPPTIAPRSPQMEQYLSTNQLAARLGQPGFVLVDVRTDEEVRDDIDETIPLGRIPGAVAIPWTSTLRDDAGRLKSPDELRALFAAAGVTPDRTIVLSGRFGVETSHTWLVLKLLGYPTVVIHDGGWADWARNPALPRADVETP